MPLTVGRHRSSLGTFAPLNYRVGRRVREPVARLVMVENLLGCWHRFLWKRFGTRRSLADTLGITDGIIWVEIEDGHRVCWQNDRG